MKAPEPQLWESLISNYNILHRSDIADTSVRVSWLRLMMNGIGMKSGVSRFSRLVTERFLSKYSCSGNRDGFNPKYGIWDGKGHRVGTMHNTPVEGMTEINKTINK